jgi:hypothetical protein
VYRALLIAAVAAAGCERAEPVTTPAPTALREKARFNVFAPKFPVGPLLAKDAIRAGIKAEIVRIAECYELVLLQTPGLAGTVRTSFLIEKDGRVVTAEAKGLGAAVDTCVADVLRTLQFPSAGSPTRVNYPFTFRPTSEAGAPEGIRGDVRGR